MRILHLADRGPWSAARAGADYTESTRGRSLADEGFLHACTSAQLPGVVQRYYTDADPAAYLLLVVDVDACESAGTPVRWDPVGDDHYPHLYGPLPVAAVVADLAIETDWQLPDLQTWQVAAHPPR
jgi:uncharacterized protein (DUF952 family)